MLTRRCWIILLTALALFACGALAEGAPGLGLSEIAPVGLEIDEAPTLATDLDAVSLTLADVPLDSGDIPVANDDGEWSVSIDKANFPSKVFRDYVKDSFDQDGDGKLSRAEADAVFEITLRTWEDWEQGTNKVKCPSLKGVEYFENLNSLCCPECGITSLDVSKNPNLDFLFVYGNKLSKLDLGRNKKLTWLDCAHNMLSKLDLSKNTKLERMTCSYNKVKSLNISKCAKLEEMGCEHNYLMALDVSGCPKLWEICCSYNKLTALDLSRNRKMSQLSAEGNRIDTIDLKNCPGLRKCLILLSV